MQGPHRHQHRGRLRHAAGPLRRRHRRRVRLDFEDVLDVPGGGRRPGLLVARLPHAGGAVLGGAHQPVPGVREADEGHLVGVALQAAHFLGDALPMAVEPELPHPHEVVGAARRIQVGRRAEAARAYEHGRARCWRLLVGKLRLRDGGRQRVDHDGSLVRVAGLPYPQGAVVRGGEQHGAVPGAEVELRALRPVPHVHRRRVAHLPLCEVPDSDHAVNG
mmetsp:Transcript_69959/g.221671  ORF Transcript_69959/g.221671 Transcript_69959/m.221671 type:complete len:219 (-) Transcript_69959:883-1539(-)